MRALIVVAWLLSSGVLPAQTKVIEVTTLVDGLGVPGSLRSAIEEANRNAFAGYAKISIVFDASLAGGTLQIASSLKTLPIINADGVELMVAGVNPQSVKIATATNPIVNVLALTGDGCQFRNLEFINQSVSATGGDNVVLIGADNALFENCVFSGSVDAGLNVTGSLGVTVRQCSFAPGVRQKNGILFHEGSANLIVDDCDFISHERVAVILVGAADVRIENSRFDGNLTGISMVEVCRDVEIRGNTFQNHGDVAVFSFLSPNLTVVDNMFLGNDGSGLSVTDKSSNVLISGNTFNGNGQDGNPSQLQIVECNGVSIDGNRFENGFGLGLSIVGSTGVDVGKTTANAFTVNARGAISVSSTSGLAIRGNTMAGNGTSAATTQLKLLDTTEAAVTSNTITEGQGAAVSIERCENVVIADGNLVDGHGQQGLTVKESTNVDVGPMSGGGNIISNNDTSVTFDNTTGRVHGNTISGNRQTVLIQGNGSVDVEFGPGNAVVAGPTAEVGIRVDGNASGVIVKDNTFAGYTKTGIRLVDASGTTVRGNAFAAGSPNDGFGIWILNSPDTSLFQNDFKDHGAGGLMAQFSDNLLVGPGNLFHGAIGGTRHGMQVVGSPPSKPSVRIESSAVLCAPGATNGRGLILDSVDAVVNHVTIANFAVGVYATDDTTLVIANSILWNNSARDRLADAGADATMDFCIFNPRLFEGTWSSTVAGSNLTSAEANYPRFADLAGQDIHLMSDSPAIDTASATILSVPTADLDLDSRIVGPDPDRGADEFVAPVPERAVQSPTPLLLAGRGLRVHDQNVLSLRLDAGPERSHEHFYLLASFAGTSPGTLLPSGRVFPLVLDGLSAAWFAVPGLALGTLDGLGASGREIAVPPEIIPLLPGDLFFAFATQDLEFVSNPVAVRFIK